MGVEFTSGIEVVQFFLKQPSNPISSPKTPLNLTPACQVQELEPTVFLASGRDQALLSSFPRYCHYGYNHFREPGATQSEEIHHPVATTRRMQRLQGLPDLTLALPIRARAETRELSESSREP